MERALTAVIQDAYVQGISAGSVDDLVTAIEMSGVSKSHVSRVCKGVVLLKLAQLSRRALYSLDIDTRTNSHPWNLHASREERMNNFPTKTC
jgi:transposase-like protein